VCVHACISVCLSMNGMFEYEHVCLKYKIVHGDADAHCSQCVFISFPQTPRSQDLSRDSNTGLVQISSGKGHCFLSLSLSLMFFSHSHPSLSLSLHLISLSSLCFFSSLNSTPHILNQFYIFHM